MPHPHQQARKRLRSGQHLVTNGQKIPVDGVEMVFYTDYDADTDDTLIVHLPEKHLAGNNHFWPMFPNFYPLRGSEYRDPTVWTEALRQMGYNTMATIRHSWYLTGTDSPIMTLHLRGAVAEIVPDASKYYRQPDFGISMPMAAWAGYYVGDITLDALLDRDDVKCSDRQQVKEFLSLFDQVHGSKALLIAPSDIKRPGIPFTRPRRADLAQALRLQASMASCAKARGSSSWMK
jgi:hypothetical protein